MKLNKIIFVGIGLSCMIGLSSCEKYFEDYVESPNSATSTTPGALLTAIEVSTFSTHSGQLARFSAIMTQQTTGTDFQLADLNKYIVLEGNNQNEWDNLYSGAMIDCKKMEDSFGAENPYYLGISNVLKAMNLGIATDFWGDVPYTEALDGENGNFNPNYDAQQSVLTSIQSLLDAGLADLNKAVTDNVNIPGSDDLIFGGDIDAWKRAAYVLKARYANRLSSRDPSGSATEVLSIFSDAMTAGLNMTSTADDLNAVFGDAGNNQNQWYAFDQSRGGYQQMSEFFITFLQSIDDPRLPFYALEADAGGYSGTPITSADQTTSKIGTYLAAPTQSLGMVTYVEALFLQAEANLRAGNMEDAATAHNDAIQAHIMLATGAEAPAAYITAQASETGATISLDKIMTHKYVAGFGQIEVWADWRRTDVPALTPNPDGFLNTIPVRLPTPQDERITNSNATVVSNATSNVWWDND